MPAGVSGMDDRFGGICECEGAEVFEGVSGIVHRMKTEKKSVSEALADPIVN
jgi:hypothetical protein